MQIEYFSRRFSVNYYPENSVKNLYGGTGGFQKCIREENERVSVEIIEDTVAYVCCWFILSCQSLWRNLLTI